MGVLGAGGYVSKACLVCSVFPADARWRCLQCAGLVTGANFNVTPTLCMPYTIPSCDHHLKHPIITPCGAEVRLPLAGGELLSVRVVRLPRMHSHGGCCRASALAGPYARVQEVVRERRRVQQRQVVRPGALLAGHELRA